VGAGDEICNPFGFANGADTIMIDIKLVIPSDATVGQQNRYIYCNSNCCLVFVFNFRNLLKKKI